MPMAFVLEIHFVGVRVKELSPASSLKASNSMPLKSGLWSDSQTPRNSMVFLFLIQFCTTIFGSSLLYLAMSVSEM